MKKTIRRSLALALAVLMLLTVSPMGWATTPCADDAHVYTSVSSWLWNDDGTECSAKLTCDLCQSKITVDEVSLTEESRTPATCESDGKVVIKATITSPINASTTKEFKIDKLTHDFTGPVHNASSGKHYWKCKNCAAYGIMDGEGKPVLNGTENCSGGTASCTEKAICSVCNTAYGDKPEHNKTYSARVEPTCQAPGQKEYWYCSRCEKYYADEACTTVIAEADLAIPQLTNHDPEPGDEWKYFANDGGAFKCNVGGYKLPLCKYCGALLEDEEYKVDVAAGDHVKADYESYFSNVEGEAFDCAKGGYKVTLCVKCGQERTPKTTVAPTVDSHGKTVHDEIVYAAVPPTCTKAGISRYEKCKKCGTITSGAKEIIPSGGHTPDPVDAHEPTCTQDGNIAYYTCSVCHMASPTSDGPWYADDEDETALEKAGVIINANGHDFATQKAAKAATCTEDGNREVVKCSVSTCNQLAMVMTESEKDQEGVYKQGSRYYKNITSEAEAKLIKTDHTWVKNYEDPAYKPATCSSEGSVPAVCHCGATTTLPLEKTKHTNDDSVPVKVVAPTCERGKYETHKCKVCGQNYDIDYYDEKDPATNVDGIKPLGHIYSGQAKQVKDATCTEAGIYGRPCTRSGCDSVADMQRKPAAKGHDYQNYEQKATCTEAGFTAKKCSRCGDVINKKDIPAAGHKDDNKDAKCDVCGKILCDHICHDENIFKKFIWFIMNVWNQFLGINDTCKCGLKHYTKTSNLVVNG